MPENTTRTFTHPDPGPVELAITSDVAVIEVIASQDTTTVTVEVRPLAGDTSPETAKLVEQVTAEHDGRQFAVRMPRSGGHVGGVTTITRHGGNVTIHGDVTGEVVGVHITGDGVISAGRVSGVTIVNGQVISGPGTTVIGGGAGRLAMIARVPAQSLVELTGTGPDLTARGPLEWVQADTGSGDLTVDGARTVRAKTMSGDVRVTGAKDARAKTMSGDVTVRELAGRAEIHTMSGDVRVEAVSTSTVNARSMSGDIALRAPEGVYIDAHTKSMSGEVTNRRL